VTSDKKNNATSWSLVADHRSLSYGRRFFAFATAEIIQLCATRLAFRFDLNLGDAGGVERENALDTFAVGNTANGKCFVQTATLATNHDPGKDLNSLLISLDDASVHANTVADLEGRAVAFLLLFFDNIENAVHKRRPGEGRAFTLQRILKIATLRLFTDLANGSQKSSNL
jgi:hypothetical protein